MTRWSRRPVAVALVLHGVGHPAGDPARQVVPQLNPTLFERHLRYLERRYTVVPARDLWAAMVARCRGERVPVAITFDDDLHSHVTHAAPMLWHRRQTATFFITGATLDRAHAFWWQRLQRAIDAGLSVPAASRTLATRGGEIPDWNHDLTSVPVWAALIEELRPEEQDAVAYELLQSTGPDPDDSGLPAKGVETLMALGMDVGFHTRAHRRLTSLSDEELSIALVEGRESVERIVGGVLAAIAYPHGKVDNRTIAAARRAGYRQGFTTQPEAVTAMSNPLALGRIAPSRQSTLDFARQLAVATRSSISPTPP